jgi:hypothetical protein
VRTDSRRAGEFADTDRRIRPRTRARPARRSRRPPRSDQIRARRRGRASPPLEGARPALVTVAWCRKTRGARRRSSGRWCRSARVAFPIASPRSRAAARVVRSGGGLLQNAIHREDRPPRRLTTDARFRLERGECTPHVGIVRPLVPPPGRAHGAVIPRTRRATWQTSESRALTGDMDDKPITSIVIWTFNMTLPK